MAKPVVLRNFRWDTIAAAKAAFKAILYAYEVGEEIGDPTHDAMLRELLEVHPRYEEKVGVGVANFYIGRTQQEEGSRRHWSGRGIWIRRVDNSIVDFGYNVAITGPSPKADAKDAMRHAVHSRRERYRESRYRLTSVATCFLTGGQLHEMDAQVIYVDPTWEQLTFRFAEREGGWENIKVTAGGSTAQVGGRLADQAQLQRWLDFFDAHANMEVASASAAARRPASDETAWWPED